MELELSRRSTGSSHAADAAAQTFNRQSLEAALAAETVELKKRWGSGGGLLVRQ
jgi:hypothetical protein